jgi:hypothetical protein
MATFEEFEKANALGAERTKGPCVVAARYDRRIRRVVLRLSSGLDVSFLPRDAQGLEQATASDLEDIEISPSGLGIHFPKIDADLYIPALLAGFLGSEKWAAARSLGAIGGRAKTEAKVTAARQNGLKGGRPKKTSPG